MFPFGRIADDSLEPDRIDNEAEHSKLQKDWSAVDSEVQQADRTDILSQSEVVAAYGRRWIHTEL